MSELHFRPDKEGRLLLPKRCIVTASCYESQDEREVVTMAMEKILHALALVGMDLRDLDGITMSDDCRADATALENTPDGQIPLEMSDLPDTMEMARTVAVRQGKELKFHIVLRAGIGLMALSPEKKLQELAYACIAHEAAHVEHEGHLSRTFPGIYNCPLECGDRSRQTFLKSLDVWSEYAASRSSAMFRPEAVGEFEDIFCRAFEASLAASVKLIARFRQDRNAKDVFVGIQQLFGDVFIHAGYFLGHLDGLELTLENDAPRATEVLQKYPQNFPLFVRLGRVLHELWLSEYTWRSIEVFTPIYELIREMMSLHGLKFARDEDKWRIVMREDAQAMEAILNA